MTQPVIFAERRQIKPAKRRALEAAGYLVVEVDDIDKIKAVAADSDTASDDGFKLDDEQAA